MMARMFDAKEVMLKIDALRQIRQAVWDKYDEVIKEYREVVAVLEAYDGSDELPPEYRRKKALDIWMDKYFEFSAGIARAEIVLGDPEFLDPDIIEDSFDD